jgi:hypothetical protein
MKGMRRRAGWLVVPVLLVSVAGCGGGSGGSDASSPDVVSSSTDPAEAASTPDDGATTPEDATTPGDEVSTPDEDATTPDDGSADGDGPADGDGSGDEGATTPEVPSEVRATEVTEFEMVQGRPQWESGARDRAANVVLDLTPDGSFSFTTVDTVGVPVTGSYSVSGSEVDFGGQTQTQGPAGSSTLEVQGSVDLDGRTMSLHWIGSSGMGAVVDDQQFASATSEAWDAQVDVDFQ